MDRKIVGDEDLPSDGNKVGVNDVYNDGKFELYNDGYSVGNHVGLLVGTVLTWSAIILPKISP